MAVASTMPAQQISSLRHPDEAVIPPLMASRRQIVEEAAESGFDEKIYVAVGKDLDDSKLALSWALSNFKGKKMCILHVHQPAEKIPMMGTKFAVSQMEAHQVRAYREIEREDMDKLLRYYSMLCNHAGVHPDLLHIEMQSIERGIVKLISQHGIRKLVMGAAADKHYSKKMTEPKSKKAIFLRLQAPEFCQILFICKGRLIYTRQSRSDVSHSFGSMMLQSSPNSGTRELTPLRSSSVTEGSNGHSNLTVRVQDHRIVQSDNPWMKVSTSSHVFSGGLTPSMRSSGKGSFSDLDGISRRSPSSNSQSSHSSLDVAECSGWTSSPRAEPGLKLHALNHIKEEHHVHSSPPSVLEGVKNDEIYDQLEQAMAEAEHSKRDAFEESMRRRKAEKDAVEAVRRVKTLENLHAEELRKRKEIDEALANRKEELEKMKQQVDEVMDELHAALEQKTSLQSKIVTSNQMVQDLEEKMFSAVELLQKYKKERDELVLERDNALKVAEDLRKRQVESSDALVPHFFSEFSFSEIVEATRNFDPSLKIGEGGYGSIYRSFLRHTEVAIKMLHSHSSQGPLEFQQEVNILSKLRHPNLVTLIGACPEACGLVYEYLPNGSLEDRIDCKDNTPPLSWQTRIRIATELCSVLIFLHSCNSRSIVHGDLKPANILLDANFVSKLSDFGICRIMTEGGFSSNNITLCCRTDPKGTLIYIDPEFLATGELTPKSDVYSFGIILLRLLTGKPALGLAKDVQLAIENGNLNELLDPTAGDWPFVQAKQLAHLAIRCCEMNRRSRPDLPTEVWRTLEPMRVSCGVSSFRMSSEEHRQTPPYFICPIFQEIMQDPHVAADGYTYELEALKGWLDSGHETSPMTNLKLSHQNLIPNHALRSAIQEWLQQP